MVLRMIKTWANVRQEYIQEYSQSRYIGSGFKQAQNRYYFPFKTLKTPIRCVDISLDCNNAVCKMYYLETHGTLFIPFTSSFGLRTKILILRVARSSAAKQQNPNAGAAFQFLLKK